jgi:hypothetical protein
MQNAILQIPNEVILLSTVSRSMCLDVGHPPEIHDQILITVGHLWGSSCGDPSLTTGRVCNLLVQLLLCLARAVTLGSKNIRTRDHILLSHFGPGSIYVASYISQSNCGGILPHLHTGILMQIRYCYNQRME